MSKILDRSFEILQNLFGLFSKTAANISCRLFNARMPHHFANGI